MAYKFRSDVEAYASVKSQGKNTGTTITDRSGNVYQADANGNVDVPLMSTDDVNYITSSFPLSQFGSLYSTEPLGISAAGFNLTFSKELPLFMAGAAYTLPAKTITDPGVTGTNIETHYVYVILDVGVADYLISKTQRPESSVNMYIGQLTVFPDGITGVSINKVSRFDDFRVSATKIGSAIPISSGTPDVNSGTEW
ncbi:hypothetical protein VWH97_06970 [Escherichia coli O157]|nr:hypothetical protein [Escherichia coli O157]